jgi:hypothetical protein
MVKKPKLRIHPTVEAFRPRRGDPRTDMSEPRIAQLLDGSLIVSHRVGSSRISLDGSIQFLHSAAGDKWVVLGRPFETAFSEQALDLHVAPICVTKEGLLLAMVGVMDRSNPAQLWRNPTTDGRVPLKMFVARSSDRGLSWSTPSPIDLADCRQAIAYDAKRLNSGRVLGAFETFKEYDDLGDWNYLAGTMASDNSGETWRTTAAEPTTSDGTMWWDPRFCELPDGRLAQFYHAFNYRSGRDLPVHVAWSEDEGNTWSYPVSTNLVGQEGYPVALSSGILLLAVQCRHEPRGIVVHLSTDGGRTFNPADGAHIYRHNGQSLREADGSLTASQYFEDMDSRTFGQQSGIATSDTSAVFCYYAGAPRHGAILATSVSVET